MIKLTTVVGDAVWVDPFRITGAAEDVVRGAVRVFGAGCDLLVREPVGCIVDAMVGAARRVVELRSVRDERIAVDPYQVIAICESSFPKCVTMTFSGGSAYVAGDAASVMRALNTAEAGGDEG